jgi:outer membrane protein assembly factor BamB
MSAAAVAALAGASEEINETRKLVPWNLGEHGSFGFSIAANLTRTVTGTPFIDLNNLSDGAAYVHNTNTGQQLFRLLPNDKTDFARFGFSVAATGQRAIVGAPSVDGPVDNCGAVYIFDIQTGEQDRKLTASDAATFDAFGHSVSASGTRVIIGALGNDDNGTSSGAAYVFDMFTGQQLHKFTASDAASGDQFGRSVAISNNLAVVGARDDDYNGLINAGSAYVFNAFNGQQLHKLTPDQPVTSGNFGFSVAISGNLIVVGSREDDGGFFEGAAYVFDAVTGEQLHRLSPPNLSSFDYFGESVAINGSLIVVGARGHNPDGGGGSLGGGAAFVFDAETGQELYRLTASDREFDDEFGKSVAVLGTRAFVGATREADSIVDTGGSYIFDITPCFADVNDDNTVDLADLNIILGNFGNTTPNGDTNFDGVVDLADLNRVLNEFGTECP